MELIIALALLEILADPSGSDNNQEFIELSFNYTLELNETINNTNHSIIDLLQNQTFLFADSSSNDTLDYLTTLGNPNSSEQYLLIVEEGFNHSQIQTNNSCHIFSAGATIGNNLNNDEDELLLFHGETLLVNKSYTLTGCAAGEGCSLHEYNGSFVAQEPSPCSQTSFSVEIEEPTCELNLSLEAETIYELGEAIRFNPSITGENYTLTYWWENLYGEVLKKPTSTTNDNPKQYTPTQPEGENDFTVLLYARLENHCNETQASHLTVVKGEEQTIESSGSSGSSSSSSSSGSGTVVISKKPLFTFSAPKTSYGNVSLTTTVYYPEQKGTFGVASYAYRGSKNYSSREPINISVNEMNVSQTNIHLEPGNYSIKTQVWFPGRKTPEEERRELIVLETPVLIINQSKDSKTDENAVPRIQASAVQTEDSSFRIPWTGLLFGLGLAALALIRHRSDGSESESQPLPAQDPQDQNQESASERNTTLHRWIAKEENRKAAAHQTS